MRILNRVDGEGILSIRYRNLEQLDDIARRLETGQQIVGTAKPSALQLERRREEAEERAREEANKGPRMRRL